MAHLISRCQRAAALAVAGLALLLTTTGTKATPAQQQQQGRARFDVTHYRIEAELKPAEHILRATGDVTFTPLDATRSVVFELNGSLKVEGIERNGKPLTSFVQDPVGVDTLGPVVRVDLGEVVQPNVPVTLRFRWGGALVTPEGGPLATKRLAYVGEEGSYLMYAARWFPFHDYAADRATAEITMLVPTGVQVAGVSDEPVTAQPRGGLTAYRFVNRQPTLVGSFAAGRYVTRTLKIGGYDLQFFAQPGSENRIEAYGELIGRALEFYTKQYGRPAFGTRYVITQIDDESLEAYAAPGMQFLSARFFDPSRMILEERVQREAAYQWWGFTVGLKSFDDAWLSQGLAEWSAFAFRESRLTGAPLENAERDMQERALLFEQSASILRAPSTLDDTSPQYQSIVFHKGAMVFRMLRETLGKAKFDQLLGTFLEQYRGKSASIDDFERVATQVASENMRYFFARWVEGTGVPEFTVDYQIIRTRAGKFRTRGTVKQNFEGLRMPVEVMLRAEGENNNQTTTLLIQDKSEDFDFESNGSPLEVVVDPNNRILRLSEDLRVSVVARRGIELYREGQLAEAQRQLEEALKLDKSNSWVYYNLGLIYLEQRNYDPAIDSFKAALDGNLKPSWIEVWARIKMGNAYDAKGDRTRATNEYNKAVESGINYDNAQQTAKQYLATPYDPRATTAATQSSSN
ncbi:MAG: tetratricopeptide repeat protein [Pyrinomonadaceae bacterium]|nr:tetratricopeptide repeat protein [Pyrinomonadaceae bacterium]